MPLLALLATWTFHFQHWEKLSTWKVTPVLPSPHFQQITCSQVPRQCLHSKISYHLSSEEYIVIVMHPVSSQKNSLIFTYLQRLVTVSFWSFTSCCYPLLRCCIPYEAKEKEPNSLYHWSQTVFYLFEKSFVLYV